MIKYRSCCDIRATRPDKMIHTWTIDEKMVILQEHGDRLRPIAFFSSKLDSVAAGFPIYLTAVAAAEKAITASRDLVGYQNLTRLVPHSLPVVGNVFSITLK